MKLKINILLCCLATWMCSCNFLEKFPDSNADIEIDNLDKISELLTGAYPQSSYFRFLELRTDNVGDKRNSLETGKLDESMYYWLEFDELEPDSPKAYWLECYRGIAQANKALEELAKYSDKSDAKTQALYAEAFLIRAYLHFMVANIWAPAYQSAEESKKLPGIPYVETPEKNAVVNYPIENLQATYEKIERDLRYGLSWVRDDFYAKPKFHFNKKAAYAFAVRFFSYTGKWQEVVDYSSYVVGTQPHKSITHASTLKDMSIEQRSKYHSAEINPSNLLITTTESLWQMLYINGRYGLDKGTFVTVVNRENAKSLRRMEHLSRLFIRNEQNSAYMPKFFNFKNAEGLINSKRGHFTQNVLLTVEETLLHRAQAYAMLENYELAMNDINTYYLAMHRLSAGVGDPLPAEDMLTITTKDRDRIQPFYRPLNTAQASLTYIISELMRQQFIHEGLRWFDLRRFNLGVDRNAVGEVKQVRLILRPEDERKTLQFPNEVNVESTNKL